MSPSEVIIEVYIMPEDASFGAFFFQFKDFITREKDVFISLPLCNRGLAGVSDKVDALEQQAWPIGESLPHGEGLPEEKGLPQCKTL